MRSLPTLTRRCSRPASRAIHRRPIRLQCFMELFCSIPIVIPFQTLLWVSLEAFFMELYSFTAFAKKTLQPDQAGCFDPETYISTTDNIGSFCLQ